MNVEAFIIKLYGMSRQVAWSHNICIRCKQEVITDTELDLKEYKLSALCPKCFNELTNELTKEDE